MHFRIKSLCTSYHRHVCLFLITVLLATNLMSLFGGVLLGYDGRCAGRSPAPCWFSDPWVWAWSSPRSPRWCPSPEVSS
jgi:hypothetical protein